MEWSWEDMCGLEGLRPWNPKTHDVGYCFQRLFMLIPALFLLATVSSFYIGRRIDLIIRGKLQARTILFRSMIALLLTIVPLIKVYKIINDRDNNNSAAIDYFTCCTEGIAWLVHFFYILSLQQRHGKSPRGPILVLVIWSITALLNVISLRTIILLKLPSALALTTLILQIIYGISLLPSAEETPTYYSSYPETSQYSQLSENHPLLQSFIENYGILGTAMSGASIFSKLLFCWVYPIFTKGVEGKLKEPDDLFDLPPNLSCYTISRKIEKALIGNTDHFSHRSNSLSRTNRGNYGAINNDNSFDARTIPNVDVVPDKKYNISLFKALHSCFGVEFYSIGLLKLLADVSGFAGPLLLNKLVSFIEDSTSDVKIGYIYASGLLLSSLTGAFCDSHFNMYMTMVSLKLRAAIMSTVFRKTLSVTSTELNNKFSIGEMTNFISTDTDRIVNACPSFHSVWSIPFQLTVTLYLLYTQVGISFLAGVGFSVVLIPINRYVANKIGSLSTNLMHHKDERVSILTEIIKNIKTIKLYVWEDFFLNKIDAVRSKEIKYLKARKYLDAVCVFFWATTPVMVTTLTLTTYTLLGNSLDAATVFTTLALLNMLIAPLNAFPWVLNGLTEAWVSIKRIQQILDLQDLNEDNFYKNIQEHSMVISLNNTTFIWPQTTHNESSHKLLQKENKDKHNVSEQRQTTSETETHDESSTNCPFKLLNISININRNDFVGIFGTVGSGKSSLLKAILAEMTKSHGDIFIHENHTGFAYVSQKPWLQRGSIKNNILFGKAYEESKFRTVVEACGLTEDITILGSDSCVGEGGNSLSGGQVARIALARAVYQDMQVYLLDDVLSAVDLKVGMHIYKKCILGLLKHKTRILVTHSLNYINQANNVILMENGSIKQQGPPSVVFNEIDDSFDCADCSDISSLLENQNKDVMDDVSLKYDETNNSMSNEEIAAVGNVNFWVISLYWKSIGRWFALAIFMFLFLMQLSRNGTDIWLSYWVSTISTESNLSSLEINNFQGHNYIALSNNNSVSPYSSTVYVSQNSSNVERVNIRFHAIEKLEKYNNSTDVHSNNTVVFYLSIYAGFALINSIFTLIRAFMFAYGGVQAAIVIHKSLLQSVIVGKMKFFDVTPAGRLLNRFSSDTYSIDDSLPFILNILLAQIFGIIGSIILTVYGLPWVCLVMVPLLPIYHWLQQQYRITSRELKRLSSITLSPIYSFFNDTIEGSTVIRAFGRSNQWCQNGEHFIERSQKANFSSAAATQWLGLRLRLMSSAVLTGAAIVAVAQKNFDGLDAGLVGLSISYALSMTSLLSGVINAFTETEREIIAVERVGEYIKHIEPESTNSTETIPPYGWPSMGMICFKDVILKYRSHLMPSLKQISFETYPSEKIGVVGRTGAGKSSLFASLFRICELHSGKITIDSVDISYLPLTTLRSRLAIIPQNPFIFTGTVRQNLDPLEQYSDIELWNALEKCGSKSIIKQKGGLNSPATDLSRGHIQLLCLTRAILQNAKILCIDEATANIDYETDRMIQETIRCSFRKSTVITIAHRISTILNSDRIIVMSEGQILEFDTPDQLMQNENSHFHQFLSSISDHSTISPTCKY